MAKLVNVFLLSVILVLISSTPVVAAERLYNVKINDSAEYLIEKFKWNSEYTLIEEITITLNSDTIEIRKNEQFNIEVKSVGNALLCEYDDKAKVLDVICSNSFLNPYIPELIHPVFSSLEDWEIYADGIESVNPNIIIQTDSQYYQETESTNSSEFLEIKYLKFNIQNGFVTEFYYQYYEGNDFKNFREVQIKRLDEDTWTTLNKISTSSGEEYFITILSILSFYVIKRNLNKKVQVQKRDLSE